MLRILHDTKFDFIKWWQHAVGRHRRVHRCSGSLWVLGGHTARRQLQHRVHRRHADAAPVRAGRRTPMSFARRSTQAGFTGAEIQQFGDATRVHRSRRRRGRQRARRRTPTASAAQIDGALEAKLGRRIRRRRAHRGRRTARRRGAETQGDHRDPDLVPRHADLSRLPLRVALRRRGRHRHGARRPHDARVPRDDASRGLAHRRRRDSSP